MDPNLWELLAEGAPADEVSAVLRLREPGVYPRRVRAVAELGSIVTCRLMRADIASVRSDPAVASMKAARPLIQDGDLARTAGWDGVAPHDERRPATLPESGRQVVIGVVDWGVDFAQPAFRHADGRTRLTALWDQRGAGTGDDNPYGYGRIFRASDIDAALGAPDPYGALGYHPADVDAGDGTHGTHVLDIAAGNGTGGGPAGIAPAADLVFVHLAAQRHGALDTLGDSVTVLEALDFIARAAGDRPLVVNLSLGNHGGPHDGSTLVEQAFDQWLLAKPGRAICQSTGNYLARETHAALQLRPDERAALHWQTDAADRTPNELEVWYPASDRLTVQVTAPSGESSAVVPLGGRDALATAGREVCRIYHRERDPNNGDHVVNVFLDPGAPPGTWTVELVGADVIDGRVHAWIERDEGCLRCQSRFSPAHAASFSTTGTICNGRRSIAAGAFDARSPDRTLAPFSSMGPTRDGRQKPDICAPGVSVLAARSTAREPRDGEPHLVRKSGTSMAAPHVTGTVALMFEAARRPLAIDETRRLLLGTASRPIALGLADAARLGSGYWDPERAVAAARAVARDTALSEEATMCCDDADHNDARGPEISGDTALDEGALDTAAFDHDDDDDDDDDSDDDDEQVDGDRGIEDDRSAGILRALRPAEVFDGLATAARPDLRQRWSDGFEVIAAPGALLAADLRAGDVLVRRALGEGGLAHAAVLATGEMVTHDALNLRGLRAEPRGPGLYVQVLESGPRPRGAADRFARRIADSLGRIGSDEVVLRPRGTRQSHHSDVRVIEAPAERVGLQAESPRLRNEDESRFPARDDSRALGGKDFLKTIWGDKEPGYGEKADSAAKKWQARENKIVGELLSGNLPAFLRWWWAVDVSDPSGKLTGTIWVLPDDLCIGKDDDFVHIPMSGLSAQRVADAFRCLLQTAKMCHDIYLGLGKTHQLTAISYDYWKTDPAAQASTKAYRRHSLAIQQQMKDRGITRGDLVQGHKKEVVISARARKGMLPFYGFYDSGGVPIQPCYSRKGKPIPGCKPGFATVTAHAVSFADYAQGVRLVHPVMRIDGVDGPVAVADVLGDERHPLLSNEGAVKVPRVPSAPSHPVPKESREIADTEAGTEYGGRPFTPVAWPFHCAPDPPAVHAATLIPRSSSTPEDDARGALGMAGLSQQEIDAFARSGGLESLVPFAELFGGACLAELLARLRYPSAFLRRPPLAHDALTKDPKSINVALASLGLRSRSQLLAPRLLLAIPGHFRELARRADDAREAYALENLGWLAAELVRDRVKQATGRDWWLPSRPPWSGRFPPGQAARSPHESLGFAWQGWRLLTPRLPGHPVQLAVLIGSTAELVDAAETLDTLKQREKQWRDSLAGRQWRIETGRAKDPATGAANPGLPFYAGVRAPWPPSPADTIRPIDRRLKALWQTGSGDRSALRPKFDREMAGAEWGDLEVVRQFPRLRGAKLQGPLPVMKLLAPHITLLFRTVRELGWNDLLFQTMGAYAFRQSTGTAGVPSNHATGLAIDINSFENPQVGRPPKGATVWAPGWSALDPRIVAIFEFFGFRWGRSIRQDSQPLAGSDPMHFELWVGTASPPTC